MLPRSWLHRGACSVFLLATSASTLAADERRVVRVDSCIAEKCKNGRFHSVVITPERYSIRIDPDRCPRTGHYCPTSYEAFTTDDGSPVPVRGYELGTKSTHAFMVYVARQYNTLFVHDVNKSGRNAALDLRQFLLDDPVARSGPDNPQDGPGSIDKLFVTLAEAYLRLDASAAADLYTEDALYLAPDGDILRGRGEIGNRLASLFRSVAEEGDALEISFQSEGRSVSGALAYDVGYYSLTRTTPDGQRRLTGGKFSVVLRRSARTGWRIHVDTFSPPILPNAPERTESGGH